MIQSILLNFAILVIIAILLFVKLKNIKVETQELLKSQGWNLYVLDKCNHCNTQLEDIPLFKEYIIYSIDGEISPKSPIKDNILQIEDIYSFPLWYNTKRNKKIYGVQDIKSLLQIYGQKQN